MSAQPVYRRTPWLALEWHGRETVLVVCATGARFEIEPALVGLLARLAAGARLAELQEEGLALSADLLRRLAEHGIVETGFEEQATSWWHPFDLDVQRQQSFGSGVRRPGQAPPTFKPVPAGHSVKLPARAELSAGLGDVISRRRSVRDYADHALELEDLGTLLHHAARVEAVEYDDELGELAFRPFASAGARSELELYVVANDVRGLPCGAHYYDARAERLVQIREADAAQAELNVRIAEAMGGTANRDPQAALIIAAAVPRVFWKYGRLGLSLIYQDLGCLYQALYLVATALKLAPCAIGGGCSLDNAEWLGLDPFLEPPIGCFAIGPAA